MAHVEELSRTMRRADCLEVLALGRHPARVVAESLRQSDVASTWWIDGGVGAIAGLRFEGGLLGPRVAQAWVLTSGLVDRHPWAFWCASRTWLAAALQRADVLYQRVDARYGKSLRWLEALGFTRLPAEPVEPSGLPFHLVFRRK